jgi:exodeoxyribonuclease VII large subunit
LNELARESLKSCLDAEVWIQGEIHGLKVHAKSGHVYFDLVEKASGTRDGYVAKISCAFFRGSFIKWRSALKSYGMQSFELASGIEVKMKAHIDLFVKEGRYQLIVSEIDPAYTFGAIARKREQTIASLRAEGLLERNKSLPFPRIPQNVGLITSEGSAAFNDFMHIVEDSGYSFSVVLFDAHMQGENTVPEVVAGIEALKKHPLVDTIAIIRGGGARTDLFSFDDLAVCKAIALCGKPVITGIGHEIDVSVADLVAHTCCVTPTDVARLLVSEMDEVWASLDQACREISYRSREILQRSGERLRMTANGLHHLTRRWMVSAVSMLKEVAFYLHTALARDLAAKEQMLAMTGSGLANGSREVLRRELQALDALPSPAIRDMHTRFSLLRSDLGRMQQGLGGHAKAALVRQQDLLEHLHSLFSVMGPSEVLRRGYSITVDSSGRLVMDAAAIDKGECITTTLARGRLVSTVKDKEQS